MSEQSETEFVEQSLAASTDDRVTSAAFADEEADDGIAPSGYLRWKGGVLQQLWHSISGEMTEWRDVPKEDG